MREDFGDGAIREELTLDPELLGLDQFEDDDDEEDEEEPKVQHNWFGTPSLLGPCCIWSRQYWLVKGPRCQRVGTVLAGSLWHSESRLFVGEGHKVPNCRHCSCWFPVAFGVETSGRQAVSGASVRCSANFCYGAGGCGGGPERRRG